MKIAIKSIPKMISLVFIEKN